MNDPAAVYEAHAREAHERDFWGQVRRTKHGEPFPEQQIQMIVEQCRDLLALGSDDPFIDLCCGNGALTTRVFGPEAVGTAVDVAPTLIRVAQTHFASDRIEYLLADVVEWAESATVDHTPTKALLYGSINFIPPDRTPRLLAAVRSRFPSVERFVIGNVADRDRLHDFFDPDAYVAGIEDDPASPIGYWWSAGDFVAMAESAGWKIDIVRMPESFTASHYRFDAVLTPGGT